MSRENAVDQDRLRDESARWYVERMSGDMTPDDERRFREWINQSPAHHKAFQSIDRAWFVAGMAKNDPVLSDNPAQSVRRVPVHGARPGWRMLARVASILLVVGLSATMLAQHLSGDRANTVQSFRTETGQRTTIALLDGTIVTLDSETAMRFTDMPKERRVELVRGRAFFKVAKDVSRPFVVDVEGQRVRAIGTAFEVSIDRGIVAVVLAEGKVRVEEARQPSLGTEMTPGRQLTINANRRWVLNNVDVKKETGWTKGRLIFMHDPLGKAIDEVNRYSTRKLAFKEGAVPNKEIVGVFSAGDVESFITALELNGIAKRISTTADEIILVEGE